jgi:hypothetical protein
VDLAWVGVGRGVSTHGHLQLVLEEKAGGKSETICKLSIFIVAYVLECRIRGEIV